MDIPPVAPAVLQALRAAQAPAIPCFQQRRGHPVLAPVGPTLQALAQGTLADALHAARLIPVNEPDCSLNLNTPRDWEDWLEKLSDDR